MKQYKYGIKILIISYLIAFSSCITESEEIVWEQTEGPTGGRIDALVINQQGDIFSAGTSGGIYRSTDEGETWVLMNKGMTFSHISDLITADDIIYALTQTDGLYSSSNDGTSWDKIDLPITEIKKIVPLGNRQIVAFSSDSILIIHKTEPENLNNSLKQISHVSATDDNIVVNSESGLFHYNVKESSWNPLPVSIPKDLSALLLTNTGSLLMGTQEGILLKGSLHTSDMDTLFRNSGKSVKSIITLRNNQVGVVYEGPWFSNIAGGGYLIKEDGQTIEKVTNGEADFVNDFILLDTNIIAAGLYGIFKSNNINSFRSVNTGLKNQRVNALVFNHKKMLFAGTYGGVYASRDRGNSWIEKNTGLSDKGVLDLVIDSEDRLFVGTYLSNIYRSINNGENWEPSNTGLPDSTWMISLGVNSKDNIFVATTNKGVYKSSDHGKTWQDTFKGIEKVGLYSLGISPDDMIYAGGIDGRVYFSADDGITWSASALDSLNISEPGVYSDNTVIEFAFREDEVFAGTASGGIFLSSSAGKSWENISYNLPIDNVRSMQLVHGRLIIGTNGSEDYEHFTGESIFLLDEEKKNWTRIDSGLFHTRIKALTLSPSEDYIFAGTWGGSVFKTSVSFE